MSDFIEITPEDVSEFWDKKITKPCALCGCDDFEAYIPTEKAVYLLLQNAKSISENGMLAGTGEGILFIPVACVNCGNTILLARHKIAAWKKEKDKKDEPQT